MKKFAFVLSAAMALLILAGCSKYNRPLVVKVMTELKKNMGDLNTAVQSKDYPAAKIQFGQISQNLALLNTVTPKKGTKEGWDSNHQAIIMLANRGMEACDASDDALIADIIIQMGQLIKEGHQMSR